MMSGNLTAQCLFTVTRVCCYATLKPSGICHVSRAEGRSYSVYNDQSNIMMLLTSPDLQYDQTATHAGVNLDVSENDNSGCNKPANLFT